MSAKKITLSNLSEDKSIVKDGFMFCEGPSVEIQYHDFFEISLVLDGSTLSNINGTEILLEQGSLIIIRPYDVHYKEVKSGCLANFGISVDALNALFNYFGDKINWNKITWTQSTPTIVLTDEETTHLANRIGQTYIRFKDNDYLASIEFRAILMELILKFAPWAHIGEKDQAPIWLKGALIKMEEKEIFEEGLPALLRLTGKSQSYLCRLFKKHYNLTPTQYINQSRIKHAAYLLSNIDADVDILTLAGEVGFESLSHFYHCFKEFYGISPKAYQKIKRVDNIGQV